MKLKELPADAKARPTTSLRFKGGILQQRYLVEEKKATYYAWFNVPEVPTDTPDK